MGREGNACGKRNMHHGSVVTIPLGIPTRKHHATCGHTNSETHRMRWAYNKTHSIYIVHNEVCHSKWWWDISFNLLCKLIFEPKKVIAIKLSTKYFCPPPSSSLPLSWPVSCLLGQWKWWLPDHHQSLVPGPERGERERERERERESTIKNVHETSNTT